MSESDSAATDEGDDEIEMLRLDPPRKTHIVSRRESAEVVVTECGLRFTGSGGPIFTGTLELDKSRYERTATKPVPEARCGNCPWESRLE